MVRGFWPLWLTALWNAFQKWEVLGQGSALKTFWVGIFIWEFIIFERINDTKFRIMKI